MKVKGLALAVVILVAVGFGLTVLISSFISDDEVCTPSGPGASIGAGGVPDGDYSKPMKEDTHQVSSGYRSADRPDHRGTDMAAPLHTPIYAFADGVVTDAGPASGFGNWIVIDHQGQGDDGMFSTVYGHMEAGDIKVKAGDQVKAGQHIAGVGSQGQSSGPHLHFEIWPGGRYGGQDTNPDPWVAKATNPGDGGSPADDKDKDKPDSPAPEKKDPADDRTSGGELPPSDKILSEEHLQVDSVRVARAVVQRFPQVQTVGGWRATDKISQDHPSGRAVDVMIPNYDTGEGKKLGDEIRDYVFGNKEAFNVEYLIWRQELIPADGEPYMMEDRFSPTDNHFDHVHITVDGGGMPAPGQKYGPSPDGGGQAPGAAVGECNPDGVGEHGRALADGEIPEELRKWIRLGGQVCREVDSPLLAGLIYHESAGFQAQAVSNMGAQGYGQFMPDTWAGKGAKVDENGEISGPPGSGSPSDPADATMAAARYLCEIAEGQREGIVSGELKGDTQTLMLAGYNAGPGRVDEFSGVPPFVQTQKYVVIVPQEAAKFADTAR
ncbi:MAG: peptidoglycan DD-metalloendopeptidase family protein [Corynebacterium sp.]|uniref:peptidoglycan DD-metalloendopeptidase family protein n=1 Tax=Corynebacterium sp. TaxID=1720 RepID=UPI00264830EF|nr:peptidoglycan DD-metalloendopeptidase family protein [Corynebacterium sp.]MDN5722204.1 peptidoglycan DD-metalloendopeptidase family protein [Corynebacterium sp.]